MPFIEINSKAQKQSKMRKMNGDDGESERPYWEVLVWSWRWDCVGHCCCYYWA